MIMEIMSTSNDNTSEMVAYADDFTAGGTARIWNTDGKHFVKLVQSLDIILKHVKHGWLLRTTSIKLRIQPSKVQKST